MANLTNPVELSFTPPQNFFMVINNFPELQFTVQRVQIPTVSAEELLLSNNVNPNKTFIPGEGMDYSPLTVEFILDKHFKNYRSILEWVKACGHPDSANQYTKFITDNETNRLKNDNFQNLLSNITIIGTDAGLTPLVDWNFYGCFPTDVDGPQFDATLQDIEYLQSSVTFRYRNFTFSTYTNGKNNNDAV